MKINFSKVFEEDLTTYGNTLRLEYYDLGDEIKRDLPAVWDGNYLSVTLDFDNIEFENLNVYYNTFSEPELKLAFSILRSEFIEACNSKEIDESGRIDHNYLSIKLPNPINANLVCFSRSDTVDFLESESVIPGANIYQDLTNNEDEYLTKDSFTALLRGNKSKNIDFPFYYNEVGKGVSNISYRRKYTSVSIYPENLTKNSNIYFTSPNKTVQILGTVTFDLYRIKGEEEVLDTEGCIESLINTELSVVQSNILSYSLDNSEKTIYFSSDNEPNTTIQLKASIDGIESNIIEIGLIEDVRVEYSSNFYEPDGNVVLLFGNEIGNKGYNPDESDQKDTSIIVITDANVDPEDIIVEPEDSVFWNYFEIHKSFERSGYDTYTERFVYKVELSTSQENTSPSWYPIVDGSSALIPCSIIIGDRVVSTFYCVQKGQNRELKLRQKNSNDLIKSIVIDNLTPTLKITEYVAEGDMEGYHLSTCVIDSDPNIYPNAGCTRSEISTSGIVTLFSTVSTQNKNVGTLVVSRDSDTDLYDENNWRDVISRGNSATINVPITSSSSRPNNYWIKTDSDYCCNGKKLLIFNNVKGETKNIIFHCDWAKGLSVIVKSGNELFNTYFNYTVGSYYLDENGIDVSPVTITLKEVYKSTTSWGPVAENNYPILLNIGHGSHSEDLYIVISPNYKNSISFFDINYNKITSSLFDYRKMFNDIYINYSSEEEDNIPDFRYWRVLEKSIENLKVAPRSNNYSLVTRGAVTGLSLVSVPESMETDGDLGKLTVIGSYNKVTSWHNYYSDWKNQLLDCTIQTLTVGYEGKPDPEKSTFSVNLKNPDGTSTPLENLSEITLDYIGLYKIVVKSNGKYRILLEDTNVSDGFYFYDRSTDMVEKNIILIDEGRYDNVKGSEVCFAYLGGEVGNFGSYSRRLRTTIKVVNLEDNSSMLFYLYRIYDNLDSNLTIETSDVGDSNYIILDYDNNKRSLNSSLQYKAYLETEISSNINSNYVNSMNIETSREEFITYSRFSETSTLVRDRLTSKFYSRGYKHSKADFTISELSIDESELHYPMKHLAVINVSTPTYRRGKVKESFNSALYQLMPCPETILSSSTVYIPYKRGEIGSVSYKTQVGGVIKYRVVTKNNPGFKIVGNSSMGDGWRLFTISAGDKMTSDYTGEEDIIVGTLEITTYVNKSNFIEDLDGNKVELYSQDQVDRMVPPTVKYVNVVLQCRANYTSKLISPGSIIDYRGETINFQVSKRNQADKVTIPSVISGVHSKTYNDLNGTLAVTYESRLVRANYSNDGFIFYPNSWLSTGSYYTTIRNSIETITTRQINSNFSITVGDEEVMSESMVQNPWPTGIYSPTTGRVYFGNTNHVVNIPIGYDATSWSFLYGFVKFSNTPGQDIDITRSGSDHTILETDYNFTAITQTQGGTTYNGLRFTFSYNNTEHERLIAKFLIFSSDNINSIEVNLYQEAQVIYTGGLYKSYSNLNSSFFVTEDDKLDAIAISASGKMIYPEHAYILTDATSVSSPSPDSILRLSNGSTSSHLTFEHNFNLTSRKIGTVRKEGDSNTYNLFEITLSGGITKLRFSSSEGSGAVNSSAAYIPYSGNCYVSLGYTTSFTIRYYHGVSNMTISPIRQITKQNNDESTKVVNYGSEYWEQKQFYSTSVYSTNANPDLGSSYSIPYPINNTINLSYVDVDPSVNHAGLFYPPLFANYGYYGAFMIDSITRSEWKKTESGWSVKNIDSFTMTGLNHSDSSVQLIPDLASFTNINGISVPGYIDDSETYSNSDSGSFVRNWFVGFKKSSNDRLNRVGIMFEIPEAAFDRSNNNVYTVTREFITASEEMGSDDIITFKIKLTLRLSNQNV